MIVDAVRWMDASVVHPVATRLAESVVNPAVLSFLLWDQLKKLTPQRARDLTRLLSIALANALNVFGAEKGQQLGANSRRLRQDFVRAASSRSGRDVALNSVATMAKVAQALNTPETKAATRQLFQTLQSVVDFFASDDGRRIIASTSECLTSVTEMAASPEASIFLAEIATNLLHTLESESRRQRTSSANEEASERTKEDVEQEERERETGQEQRRDMETDQKIDPTHPYSPTSSMADTRLSFDTESVFSSGPGTPVTGTYTPRASMDVPMPPLSPVRLDMRRRVVASSPAETNSGYRSARIEKEVLLKMGVDPSMLSEIQRVLDVITADEEEKERAELKRRREVAEYVASLVVPQPTENDQIEDTGSVGIAPAFGNNEDEDKNDEAGQVPPPSSVLLPDWHEQPLREALRRRHAHANAVAEQRDPANRQAREMAAVLAQRDVLHGDLPPGDALACWILARMIVYGLGLFLLVSGFLLCRNFFV